MAAEESLQSTIFGYDRVEVENGVIIGLKGSRVRELYIGMKVVLSGNSKDYVPGGFSANEEVKIVGFSYPFLNGETDHIIQVSNKDHEGWVKPSNIQQNINSSEARIKADGLHWRMSQKVSRPFAEFMNTVYRGMTDTDRANLPRSIGPYVDSIVSYALTRLEDFKAILLQAIVMVYRESPQGERFISDPLHSNDTTSATLYIDTDGFLVSVANAEITRKTTQPKDLYLKSYDYYIVLDGPLTGKKFFAHNRPLAEPVRKEHPENSHIKAIDQKEANKADTPVAVRIFISYSHKDERFKDE